MPGGVGGAMPRGVPLSRSWVDSRHSLGMPELIGGADSGRYTASTLEVSIIPYDSVNDFTLRWGY